MICIRLLLALSVQYLFPRPLALSWSQSSQQFYVRKDSPVALKYLHPAPIFSILPHPLTHSSSNFKLNLSTTTSQSQPPPHLHTSSRQISPTPTCLVEAPTQWLASPPLECLATAAPVPIPGTDILTAQAVDPTVTRAALVLAVLIQTKSTPTIQAVDLTLIMIYRTTTTTRKVVAILIAPRTSEGRNAHRIQGSFTALGNPSVYGTKE